VSVTVAMFCLVTLYSNLSVDLKPVRPLLMFGSIKFVIFFCFWQGIIVAGFVKINLIKDTTYWTSDNVATAVQDFLVCVEMLVAAIVHMWAFSYVPFIDGKRRTNICLSMARVIYVKDMYITAQTHVVPTALHPHLGIDQEKAYASKNPHGVLIDNKVLLERPEFETHATYVTPAEVPINTEVATKTEEDPTSKV